MTIQEAFEEGSKQYNPPAYRVEYYMTQKEYTSVMRSIDAMWNPSNISNYTFWKHKITSNIHANIIRVKINP